MTFRPQTSWVILVLVLLAGCTSRWTTVQAAENGPVVVRMQGKRFVPDKVTIRPGDTVQWVNEPAGQTHYVTTDPDQAMDEKNVSSPKGAKIFDSGKIKAGNSFQFRFTVPGTYRYTCPPHEMDGMVGSVIVQP